MNSGHVNRLSRFSLLVSGGQRQRCKVVQTGSMNTANTLDPKDISTPEQLAEPTGRAVAIGSAGIVEWMKRGSRESD